jgi:predicted nucleotidyltransferase
MNYLSNQVNRFLEAFTAWASSRDDIQAVALIGSYARGTATNSSDVDLVVISKHPDYYIKQTKWTSRFGEITRQQIEDYGKLTSIRIWYTDGLEIEYGISDENWVSFPLDVGTRQVIQDGLLILFERNEILSLAASQIE